MRQVAAAARAASGALAVSPPATPARRVVVTGVGGSEGPARMMAELLRRSAHAAASFQPLSAFATRSLGARGGTLVLFSQGLCPNARLALDCVAHFDEAFLFTSAEHEPQVARFAEQGGHVVGLPPASEPGTLVRVVGPCAAMLAAALHTGSARAADVDALVAALGDVPARVPRSAVRAGRVAFVTANGYGELCRAAKNIWLEALSAPEPPMWDVLEVVHGPLQQFFDAELTLFALERDGEEAFLFDRLEKVLVAGRHALVRLRSPLPLGVAPIDHVAQVIEIVCGVLAASPRDLGAWLGSRLDAPLYELGAEATPKR
jgi:creatinine amidohydrolase